MTAEIEVLKDNLNDKLEELRRRASHARELVVAPATLLASPWLRLGLAAVIGYSVGSLRRGSAAAANHESVLHAIVRAAASATATFAVSRILAQVTDGE